MAAAADIRSTVKTLESTACVDDKGTIEGFAWSLLFPKLSSHSHPSITARNPLMQSFKRAVITDWVHAWQRGDVSSLGDILYRLEPRFADLAGLSPHDARQAYPAWLAYALRPGAICTGNTACNIAASCLKRPLSDVECNRLKLLYGPTPLAGGANIYFLRRIIDRNKDVRSLMCEILSGLPREEYEEKFKRLVNLVTASFLVLMHLREVDGRAKRLDAAVNELEADTVEAVGLLAPPEVVENAEEFGRISAIISTLPQQDQTLISELASSLKPKEIVERHPDWQLDNKQVSDRFRALCQKIRERS
ncbi:MAG: hypothetical protein E4H01_05395 [Lysobacterales bacterium]|nr:MAG: hypothetical protein E4H01_05395 [Xanthomonadales bacterium]